MNPGNDVQLVFFLRGKLMKEAAHHFDGSAVACFGVEATRRNELVSRDASAAGRAYGALSQDTPCGGVGCDDVAVMGPVPDGPRLTCHW